MPIVGGYLLPSCGGPFAFIMGPFEAQKVLILMISTVVIFPLVVRASRVKSKVVKIYSCIFFYEPHSFVPYTWAFHPFLIFADVGLFGTRTPGGSAL